VVNNLFASSDATNRDTILTNLSLMRCIHDKLVRKTCSHPCCAFNIPGVIKLGVGCSARPTQAFRGKRCGTALLARSVPGHRQRLELLRTEDFHGMLPSNDESLVISNHLRNIIRKLMDDCEENDNGDTATMTMTVMRMITCLATTGHSCCCPLSRTLGR